MDSIRRFLAHAVRLEAESARRFDELSDHMRSCGNDEVADVFAKFADFSRLHLKDAMARAGFRYITDLPAGGYDWPDGESPETAAWWGVDALMDTDTALDLALQSERQGLDFYRGVAAASSDPRVVAMAEEFAEEEAGHVAQLEAMVGGRRAV